MTDPLETSFLEAVHSRQPVTGLTHDFYRYPARFSPLFARAAIQAFTRPGDVVLDPFMGGGTTLVEARALGRRTLGTDISSLATFVTRVKTTPLSVQDKEVVSQWADTLHGKLGLRNPSVRERAWIDLGYQRNIDDRITWPIRKTLELALAEVDALPRARQRRFTRCVWLKTAQWALDCRTNIPAASRFRQQFFENLESMLEGALEYAAIVNDSDRLYEYSGSYRSLCLHRSTIGIETEPIWRDDSAPTLVLTSPPYPGVHVLYHRWQVQGRRETPAPFWIADTLDGNGASFYTLGDRKAKDLTSYYDNIAACFGSIAQVINNATLVVQLVAFSDPSWQLPQYLEVMEQAGLLELPYPDFANSADGRLWRSVPNRKWYADQKGTLPASKEVVLFHRRQA